MIRNLYRIWHNTLTDTHTRPYLMTQCVLNGTILNQWSYSRIRAKDRSVTNKRERESRKIEDEQYQFEVKLQALKHTLKIKFVPGRVAFQRKTRGSPASSFTQKRIPAPNHPSDSVTFSLFRSFDRSLPRTRRSEEETHPKSYGQSR